jgi:hypothetical protein
MDDSRSFVVSGVELHAVSIQYEPDDRGPGAMGRRRDRRPPSLPILYAQMAAGHTSFTGNRLATCENVCS